MNRYVALGLVNALILLALSGGAVLDITERCGALTMCRRGPGLGTWAMAVLPLLLVVGAALVFAPRMARAWKTRRSEKAAARAARAEAAQAALATEDVVRARLGRLSRGNAAPGDGFDTGAGADETDVLPAGDAAGGAEVTGDVSAAQDLQAEGDTAPGQAFDTSEPDTAFADDALDLSETAVGDATDDAGQWPAGRYDAPVTALATDEVTVAARDDEPPFDAAEAFAHDEPAAGADVAESPAASHGWTFAVETDADDAAAIDAVEQDALPPLADESADVGSFALAAGGDGLAPADRLSFAAADDAADEMWDGEPASDAGDGQQVAAFDYADGDEFGWPVVRSGDALAETLSAADESYASLPVASFDAASTASEAEVSPFASWLVAPGPVPRMRPAADTGFPWVAAMIGAVARSMLDHVDRRALGEFAAEVEAWVQIADEMPAATPIGADDADAFIGWLDTLAQHLFLFGARPPLDVLITHALAELLDRAADDDALADALPPVLLGGRDSAADAA